MPWKIPLPWAAGALIAALASPVPASAQAPDSAPAPCPAAGAEVAAGWAAYRAGDMAAAGERFAGALGRCPGLAAARNGLAYVLLREGRPGSADSLFRLVTAADSLDADAWAGRALASARLGDSGGAIAAGRRARTLDPANGDVAALLARLDPDGGRPPLAVRPRPDSLRLTARVRGTRFEVRGPSGWRPFYVRGVNLGVALPGRFPAEFPTDSARYAGWLDTLAGMHANTVRVYTILPPAFYRALRGWNLTHPERPLYLIQGVWTELPPGHDFDDPEWKAAFRAEMRRAVDVVHGQAELPARPGHASGRYDADVSDWTLAWILGREWEPYAVSAWDAANPGRRAFRGRWLAADSAPAMDAWLAEQCDHLLAWEMDRHHAIRPIAYTSWPTLDPLTHPTEATAAEERAWRQRAGRPAAGAVLEYENDAIGLDPNLVRPTPENPAGWFASYHAYPYYPDFMLLDPVYDTAQSSLGRSAYFGYLRDLMGHHAGLPVLVAEYGVPSSRGIAHLQPQGWHHGGHDERRMAEVDVRLTREIREAGAAGGVLFAWLDEWFKRNWVVIDFQRPAEHVPRWHNVMDAEQHYGILGQYAGDSAATPRLGGDPARWLALPRVATGSAPGPSAIHAGADEAWLRLAIPMAGFAGSAQLWDSVGVRIAIDVLRPGLGQHRIAPGLASEIGFEFLVDLVAPDSASIRVLPEYDRYAAVDSTGDDRGRFYRRPVTVVDRDDGRFDPLFVVTNRARFARDGTFFPAAGYDRGRLRHGTEAGSSLADWYWDAGAGLLEIRIPWDLLNVADPSGRTLLFEEKAEPEFGTVPADAFRFGVLVWRKGPEPRIVAALPSPRAGRWRAADFPAWRWEPWQEPRSHQRLKPVYYALRDLWRAWADEQDHVRETP